MAPQLGGHRSTSQHLISDFATTALCTEFLWAAIGFISVTHQLRFKHSSLFHGIPDAVHNSPVPSECSTAFLSLTRDLSPRSADPEDHIPLVPDRPGSPGPLGPTGSPPTPTGSPDRRPTGSIVSRPSPPARSLDHEGHTTTVPDHPDQLESPNYPNSAGSLSIVMGSPDRPPEPISLPASPATLGAFISNTWATSKSRGGSAPTVDITGHVPRVSADDVCLTLARIS